MPNFTVQVLDDSEIAVVTVTEPGPAGPGVQSGGTAGQALVKATNDDYDTTWVDVSFAGDANTAAFFDSTNNLSSIPGWSVSDVGDLSATTTKELSNYGGNQNWLYHNAVFDPVVDSSNESWTVFSLGGQIDNGNTGNKFGDNGGALTLMNIYMSHGGSGDTGRMTFMQMGGDIGNGTDPLDISDYAFSMGFTGFHGPVTISNSLQGYVFQPGFESGAAINGYTTGFADNTNASLIPVSGWTSFNASPSIGTVQNNYNYQGLVVNPQITDFSGNAGFQGVFIGGNLGTFGASGYYNGVSINPQIDDIPNINCLNVNPQVTSCENAYGLYINMSNVTASGTKKAIEVVGDVNIDGALAFTGALSMGQLNAFYATNPADGGGNPQGMHGLITSVKALDSTTVANADTIGVNTAMLITLEDNSVTTSGPFGLGLAALALPCVVETHTGATLDFMTAAAYAVNLSGTSTGGTIDTVKLCRCVIIPNGITTINNTKGFVYDEPFGSPGGSRWGYYNSVADAVTYSAGSLVIGPTDTVTNSSVGLEMNGTTTAPVMPRLTTVQRDALTAVNGMGPIYNTDTDKFQGYAAGAWVDLH